MKEAHMNTLRDKRVRRRRAKWFDGRRFEGITRLYSARQVVEQRGTIRTDYTVARDGGRGLLRPPARAVRAKRKTSPPSGPYSPGPGGGDEADGHRGDLPRRLGDLGQGLDRTKTRARTSPAIR